MGECDADLSGREALLVKGRVYDVKTRHSLEPVDDFVDAAARQALQIHSASQAGDILIFLPGEWYGVRGRFPND